MGPGPIPWWCINEYAKRYEVGEEEFDYLVRVIRAMDDVYLEHALKKVPSGGKS